MTAPLAVPFTAPAQPTAPVIIGDNTIAWGTGGIYSGGGIAETADIVGNAKAQEVANTVGFTAAVVYFDHQQEINITCTGEGSAPSFSPGDVVSVCGVTGCHVAPGGFKVMYTQKGVTKFSLKVIKYALI